jgi:hypothetical protein
MKAYEDKKELTLSQALEKYAKKGNTVGVPPHKIFDIMIYEELYPVYSIEEYEHEYGKWNGCPTTWWLDYSKVDPKTGEKEERPLVPYIDKGVHRICWGVNYTQKNTTKHKWGELDIRSTGVCKITANGKEVYTIRNWDLNSALTSAQSIIEKLVSHPYNFLDPEKDRDRKIWYYNLPATVTPGYEPGEIRIHPDFSYISPDLWWSELERRKTKMTPVNWEEIKKDLSISGSDEDEVDWERNDIAEHKEYGSINHGDALSDGNIWWFRD